MPSAKAIEAARKYLPNWEVDEAAEPVADEVVSADAVSPSPEELKRQFFKEGAPEEPRYTSGSRRKPVAQDTEMVYVKPPGRGEDDSKKQRKALVTSNGKVIGAQG